MPNGVKSICDFRGAGAVSNKRLNLFKLAIVLILESRSIVKDELWIAGEAKSPTDIMDPTLRGYRVNKRGPPINRLGEVLLGWAPACLKL